MNKDAYNTEVKLNKTIKIVKRKIRKEKIRHLVNVIKEKLGIKS